MVELAQRTSLDPLTNDYQIASPTFEQTSKAQWVDMKYILESNRVWADSAYDPDVYEKVLGMVQSGDYTDREVGRLLGVSSGTKADVEFAENFISEERLAGEILSSSSWGALAITDRANAFAIIPFGGWGVNAGLKALSARGVLPSKVVGAIAPPSSGRAMTAKEIARLSALDGAVSQGSVSLIDAMDDISVGGEPLRELYEAAIETSLATAAAGALGYGAGSALLPKQTSSRARSIAAAMGQTRRAVDPPEGTDLSFTGKWFNESWLGKLFPSPLKRVMTDADAPQWFRQDMMSMAADGSMETVANANGLASDSSVHVNSVRRNGDWFAALDEIDQAYTSVSSRGNAQALGIPVGQYVESTRKFVGKFIPRVDSFHIDDWYERVADLYLRNVDYADMLPEEARAVQAFEGYFSKYGQELSEVNLMRDASYFADELKMAEAREKELADLTQSIADQNMRWMNEQVSKNLMSEADAMDYAALIQSAQNPRELADLWDKLDLTPTMADKLKEIGPLIDEQAEKINDMMAHIDFLNRKTGMQPKRYFPILYDTDKIAADRFGFREKLVQHFRENPEISYQDKSGKFRIVKTDPMDFAAIEARADDVIEKILKENEDDLVEALFNQGQYLASRRLNIDPALVKDYIVTNAKEVMVGYGRRVAPRIEFAKKFRHPDEIAGAPNPKAGQPMTINEYLDLMEQRMLADGVSPEKIDKFRANFAHTYDVVVGATRKRVDAWDTDMADAVKKITQMAFLRTSGIAALGDASAMFMDNELSTIGKAFLASFDGASLKLAKREAMLAGEIYEHALGSLHGRFLDGQTVNPLRRTTLDKFSNVFMQLNGLGPITHMMKVIASLVQTQTLYSGMVQLADGTADDWTKSWLARFGIDKARAKAIINQPWQTTDGGMRIANTEAWTDEAAVVDFRNALSSNIYNRVISGQPADRPMMMDGVAYVPDHIAKFLPLKGTVDPRVPNHVRFEGGLMTLPFTLYSYSFGALSKITAQHASGNVRHPMAHMVVALGLGYAITKYRTPNYIWDEMEFEDKVARAFDFSGLAALYTDMAYRGLAAAADAGFRDSLPIAPKFYSEPDPFGALVSLGGAPADYSYEVGKALFDMAKGNMSDGAKRLVSLGPFIGAWAFNGVLTGTAKSVANMLPNAE